MQIILFIHVFASGLYKIQEVKKKKSLVIKKKKNVLMIILNYYYHICVKLQFSEPQILSIFPACS